MPRVHRFVLALALGTALSGCAHVKVTKLESEKDYDNGIRFFRPAPHVWILRGQPSDKINTVQEVESLAAEQTERAAPGPEPKPEGAAKPPPLTSQKQEKTVTKSISEDTVWTLTLVMLPDYSEEYVVAWGAGVGSAAANVTLEDGWNLTSFGTSVDTQGDELAGAIASPVATVAAAAAGALTRDENWKGPGLYKLDFDRATKHFELGAQVLAVP